MDEFEPKYSPSRVPIDDDYDDPDAHIDDPDIPKEDIVFGKKAEHLQMNPITLFDSPVGQQDLLKNKSEELSTTIVCKGER